MPHSCTIRRLCKSSVVLMCCGVLQCVAVCCSVLQCVEVCCNALHCVAVCCSVLQCVAMDLTFAGIPPQSGDVMGWLRLLGSFKL